jgi:translation initiation factor IF-1
LNQNSNSSRFLSKFPVLRSGILMLVACCAILTSCAHAQNTLQRPSQSVETQATTLVEGDAEAIRAQQLQLVKVPLTVTARVKKLLKYDGRGLPHEKFLLVLSNGSTILVAHNTKMAPYVPIQPGDTVTVKGEFIWNAKGGLIHWTHHSDTPNHAGGYIDFNGKRYE